MKVLASICLLSSVPSSSKCLPYRYTVYIGEARKRLIYAGLSFFLAFLCAYRERVPLMYLIASPLQRSMLQQEEADTLQWENANPQEQESGTMVSPLYSSIQDHGGVRLIFTDVEEAFYTLLSVSLFWCLLASIPVLLYHTWCFLQPGVGSWQSRRARMTLSRGMLFVYLVLWLVDRYVLPRLLLFFYGFEVERASLCLDAEIKVVSYVSLYLFVNLITLALCLLTALWRFYTEKQILYSLRRFSLLKKRDNISHIYTRGLILQYQNQRIRLWWGCLLVSAILCPPEMSSQLLCTIVLILLSEASIWLAYMSSCRLKYRLRD